MFTVLRASRPVRVLYIARGISEIGNWCANIALPMLIYEVTHDVSATALMVCCRFAPSLFSVALAQLPQKMGIGTLQAMRLADLIRAGCYYVRGIALPNGRNALLLLVVKSQYE